MCPMALLCWSHERLKDEAKTQPDSRCSSDSHVCNSLDLAPFYRQISGKVEITSIPTIRLCSNKRYAYSGTHLVRVQFHEQPPQTEPAIWNRRIFFNSAPMIVHSEVPEIEQKNDSE